MAKVKQTTPTHDFVIPQGEDFIFQLKLYEGTGSSDKQPINLTNHQFRCEVREEAGDDTPAMTADCHIIDTVNGIVEIHFKADDSDSLELDGTYYGELSKYTYDVFEVDADGLEKRILCGYLYISPSVSNR